MRQPATVTEHPAEAVNELHDFLNYLEGRDPDLMAAVLSLGTQGHGRAAYLKKITLPDGTTGRKRIQATIIDNRARWQLMKELYEEQFLNELKEILQA